MTVVITGAAGKLARRVASRLDDVVGIDTRPAPANFPGTFHTVRRYNTRDVTEVFRTVRPSKVLHLGVRAGGFKAEAKERYTQNVLGTRHILAQCLKYGTGRVVVMSTYHVYGAHQHNPTFIREDAPLRAVQTFPELLDAVESDHTVSNFLWRHREVPTALLRPANMVGPSLSNQVSTLLKGRYCPRLLGFNPMQQFLHESDAVEALLVALQGTQIGVYNVAGEGAIPWLSAIHLAGSRPLALPVPIAYPAVRMLARLQFAFPAHLMDYFRFPVIIHDGAFREEFGWQPRVSLHDTLSSVKDVATAR